MWSLTSEEWLALRLSFQVGLCAVITSLPFALAIAYLLARWQSRFKWLLEVVINLPLVLPPVVTGYLLLVCFAPNGPLGQALENWLGLRIVLTWWGAALAAAVVSFPLMVRALRLAFQAIDPRLEMAARSLGAGRLDAFLSVSLPLAGRGVLAGCVLAFARSLGEFGATMMVAGNIVGETQTVPLAIFSAFGRGVEGEVWRLAGISIGLATAALVASEWLERRQHPVKPLDFRGSHRFASGFAFDVAFDTSAQVTALFGPSGSGKTSVLYMIAGLLAPQSGRIQSGDDVWFDSAKEINRPAERRSVGLVFQDHQLFPHLSVERNLLYGFRRRAPVAPAIKPERVIDVLELGDLLRRYPRNLSGGEKQRVALGRALLSEPELLLMDEPLTALDEALKDRILAYLERVIAEWHVPMIYVSHNAAEVRRLADRVVVLEHGRVAQCGSSDEVLLPNYSSF